MVQLSLRRISLFSFAAAVLVGAFGLAGCSDDAREPTASRSSNTTASTSSTSASRSSSLPEVEGSFAPGREPLPGFAEVEIRIVEGPDGEPVVLCVLVAETAAQRAQGLMGVTDSELGGYDGMLFVYDTDVEGSFWMKDTPLPLSIAYFDADGAVVGTQDMQPCPDDVARCPSYQAPGPFRQALEVPQGNLDDVGLSGESSARMVRTGACDPARE